MLLSKTLAQWAKSGHPTAPELHEASKQAERLERLQVFFQEREGLPLFGLKEARKKAGKTQVQLAELCGVAQPVLSSLESQKTLSSEALAGKIARALGVRVADLL